MNEDGGSAQTGSHRCIVWNHGHIDFILVTEHCNPTPPTDLSAKTGMNIFDAAYSVVCEWIITVLPP